MKHTICILLTFFSPYLAFSAERTIFSEDFKSGFNVGPLVKQNGWEEAVDSDSSPMVLDSGGQLSGGGMFVTTSKNDHSNNFATKTIQYPSMGSDDKLVIEITASVSSDGRTASSVTFGFGSKPMEKTIGLLVHPSLDQQGAFFRDGWNRTEAAVLPTTARWDALFSGDVLVLRSVWDLAKGTATLAVKNLTQGEETFKPLFFDQAQTQSTIDLGDISNAADWNMAFLRLTGIRQTQACIYSVKVSLE